MPRNKAVLMIFDGLPNEQPGGVREVFSNGFP
jgi:hypothetical protein